MRTFWCMRCFNNKAFSLFRDVIRTIPKWHLAWLAIGVATFAFTTHAAVPDAKPTHHASINAAVEAATADHSLVLVIFGAEWCAPCKLLKKETLPAEEFLSKAGALRIVEVDIDSDQRTATAYAVSAVPTLLLMTAEGKIAVRQTGFMDVARMLKWLNEGRERVEKGQWEGTAPGTKLNEFVTKAAADRLEEADLKKLVVLLGEPDPS